MLIMTTSDEIKDVLNFASGSKIIFVDLDKFV
jgi:hypothetical protein